MYSSIEDSDSGSLLSMSLSIRAAVSNARLSRKTYIKDRIFSLSLSGW
jgi:hypothetical protein